MLLYTIWVSESIKDDSHLIIKHTAFMRETSSFLSRSARVCQNVLSSDTVRDIKAADLNVLKMK